MTHSPTRGEAAVKPASRPAPRVPLLTAALAAALAAGLLTLAAANLGYRGMWWDEASQFWMSQGLGRSSPPFAARGGLAEVARFNARENLDPGGFSMLLHTWTLVSRSLVWLRLLPFAFSLLASLGLALLGWRLTRSRLFAVASGAVLSLYPAALYFALEIRAYSMEMAGVACGALLLAAAVERPSPRRAALLGLVCAVFMTSRYSFVLAAAALLAALAAGSTGRTGGRALRTLVAAALPIAAAGTAIAVIMLRRQLWPEMRAGALGVASPAYTHDAVLRFAADVPALLARNLLSPAALPLTAATVLTLVLAAGRLAARRRAGPAPAAGPGAEVRFALLLFATAVQALSAAVSLLGLYPWDIAGRWSAYLAAVSAVAAVTLAAEARARLPARAAAPLDGVRRLGAALAALTVAAAALAAGLHRQSVEGHMRTDVATQIDGLPDAALAQGRVFVSYYEVPALRYLYEYGPYAGRRGYPERFRLETLAEWKAGTPIPLARDGIRFVITALSPAEARARFPGCALRPCGPHAGRLLAVGPAVAPPGGRDGTP